MDSAKSLFQNALPVAMAGLRAATAKVADVCDTADDKDAILERAVIETLWWQKSLEDLWEEELGRAFYRRRDSHHGGLTVGGLAYARNVGGHRVDRSYDEVVYRAASTVESVVLAGLNTESVVGDDRKPTWPALSALPALPMEDPFGRAEMYSNHIAGRPVLEPLNAALEFFEELLAD